MEVTGLLIMEEYDEQIGSVFCDSCPWRVTVPGNTDLTGVALEPDENECPYGCDHPSDERCARHPLYTELMERADDFADFLQGVGEGA